MSRFSAFASLSLLAPASAPTPLPLFLLVLLLHFLDILHIVEVQSFSLLLLHHLLVTLHGESNPLTAKVLPHRVERVKELSLFRSDSC